jgi:hypothetical protein
MDRRAVAGLGAPDLRIAGFQLWAHGYQFPDAEHPWDGNWLRVTAHCGATGASVWVSGALLDTVSVLRFRRGLATLHETLRGEAALESHEPNVVVRVAAADGAGHLAVRVELTPDHLAQGHWFDFEADQTYLPGILAACDALLARLPVRNPAARGV